MQLSRSRVGCRDPTREGHPARVSFVWGPGPPGHRAGRGRALGLYGGGWLRGAAVGGRSGGSCSGSISRPCPGAVTAPRSAAGRRSGRRTGGEEALISSIRVPRPSPTIDTAIMSYRYRYRGRRYTYGKPSSASKQGGPSWVGVVGTTECAGEVPGVMVMGRQRSGGESAGARSVGPASRGPTGSTGSVAERAEMAGHMGRTDC